MKATMMKDSLAFMRCVMGNNDFWAWLQDTLPYKPPRRGFSGKPGRVVLTWSSTGHKWSWLTPCGFASGADQGGAGAGCWETIVPYVTECDMLANLRKVFHLLMMIKYVAKIIARIVIAAELDEAQ